MRISKLVRKNILQMKPYSSARDDHQGKRGIFLDANENPHGIFNRYPDPRQKALKNKLSEMKGVTPENIFIGNGSDEVIDILFRVFCEPRRDKVVLCPPTYGMYEVCANLNDVNVLEVRLTEAFQLNVEEVLKVAKRENRLKMIILCSPNNPSGNMLHDVEKLLQSFDGLTIVDEAYIDFSRTKSLIHKIDDHPGLVVVQTMSKAWGMAAARIGMAYASREIVDFMNKVKPPYNISGLNQEAALKALNRRNVFLKHKKIILEQRNFLEKQLSNLSCVTKVHQSDANFLLVEFMDAALIYDELIKGKIITRNRSDLIANCIRITVGTQEENQKLIKHLKRM